MMKRTLIFVGYYDNLAFDMAKSELLKGGEVYMVGCDQSVGICHCNYGATPLICKLCSHQNKQLSRHFNDDSRFHWKMMGNLVSDDIRHLAATTSFDYDDVASLKALQYKGVDIGYAAFSTYVSVTRNLTPFFNAHLKAFLDDLMRSEIRQIEALQQYVEEISPDMMVVMCGRHSNQKPIYQLAVNNHINFVVTERKWTENGEDTYDFFVNNSPHSNVAIYQRMQDCWASGSDDKYEIAKTFFDNRRYGQYAADTIYTKRQEQGLLPDGFDHSKTNIAIFNSSEDEYYSISRECDEYGVWNNQYTALKAIFEHYRHRDDIHFYLRIHPNLSGVNFTSHTILYTLQYDNVTIIAPESPVSSYALLDNCQKVMVFNSSLGLEGAYWGKPVIVLNESYYNYMGIVHLPQSEDEVYQMIDDPDLPSLKSDECLKAGYFFMSGTQKKLQYYPTARKKYGKGRWQFEGYSLFTLCHSAFLSALVFKLLRIGTYVGIIGRHNHITQRTA